MHFNNPLVCRLCEAQGEAVLDLPQKIAQEVCSQEMHGGISFTIATKLPLLKESTRFGGGAGGGRFGGGAGGGGRFGGGGGGRGGGCRRSR